MYTLRCVIYIFLETLGVLLSGKSHHHCFKVNTFHSVEYTPFKQGEYMDTHYSLKQGEYTYTIYSLEQGEYTH